MVPPRVLPSVCARDLFHACSLNQGDLEIPLEEKQDKRNKIFRIKGHEKTTVIEMHLPGSNGGCIPSGGIPISGGNPWGGGPPIPGIGGIPGGGIPGGAPSG